MKTQKKTQNLDPCSPTWGDVQRMANEILERFKALVPSVGAGSSGAANVLTGTSFYTLVVLASLRAGDGSTRGKVLDKQKIIPDTLPKKRPTEAQLRRALGGLLDMLTEWDGGFDGFHAVNQAERLLGRPKSEQPAPSGLSGRKRKSKR